MKKKELVVVTHGFAGKRLWMQPICWKLSKNYDVVPWSYFSLIGSVERHGHQFSEFIRRYAHDRVVNIVAHSMGSIVTRAAVANGNINRLGRIVLLAPPNQGSRVAGTLSPLLGWACQPLKELSHEHGSFVNCLTQRMPCETGVIAAKYDALVGLGSTFIPGLTDHVAIAATHNSLLLSRKVGDLVCRFLRNGTFATSH